MDEHPNDNILDGQYTFSDLVDVKRLTALFEKISAAEGFSIGLVDAGNHEVLIKTRPQDICKNFHCRGEDLCRCCGKSNITPLDDSENEKAPEIAECDHGLSEFVTPIIIENKHMASLITGQLLLTEPDIESYLQQAHNHGYDKNEYITALKKVPVASREKVTMVMDYLADLSEYIAQQGVDNKRTARLTENIAQNEENLKLFRLSVEQSGEGGFLDGPSGKIYLCK